VFGSWQAERGIADFRARRGTTTSRAEVGEDVRVSLSVPWNSSYTCVLYAEVECSLSYKIVGEADRTTSAGINYAGIAFLLRQEFEHDSVVFAFKGCYRNLNDVRFQIWRPTQAGSDTYRLVTEVIHHSESEAKSLPRVEPVSLFIYYSGVLNATLYWAHSMGP